MNKVFALIIIILSSCNGNSITEVSVKENATVANSKTNFDSLSSTGKKNHLGIKFYNSNSFEVVSFNRVVTLEYTGADDTSECKNWKIKKENLTIIIKNSEPIDGTTWDLAFAFTTCVINGQLKQNGQFFDYSVNAGSWFSVTCRDTTLLFGNYKQSDRKFFLQSVVLQ